MRDMAEVAGKSKGFEVTIAFSVVDSELVQKVQPSYFLAKLPRVDFHPSKLPFTNTMHFKCFDYEYDFLSFQTYRWMNLFLWDFFNSYDSLFHYKFSPDL